MRAAWLAALLLLAAATFGQAATLRVETDDSLRALHASRVDVGARFDIAATALDRAPATQAASAFGAADAPGELSEGGTPMSAAVMAGHWTYTVTVRERMADGVGEGAYAVELMLNGEAIGALHIQQAVANPAVRESARATFDLGAAAPDAALFVVRVSEAGAGIIAHALVSALRPGAPPFYVWEGGAGDNPALAARVGSELRITITNGDGTTVPHNLVILQATTVRARTDGDVDERGESIELRWTPEAAGEHRYECEYHPTMAGTLQVNP